MAEIKTVDGVVLETDPIIAKQKEDVARMRTSLLCCSDDPNTSVNAMKKITILRVYHQISRIIRYLEMMDKIESKLYESIDYRLDNIDTHNTTAWMQLLNLQERLQRNMIESHKLLQPYLNVKEFSMDDLTSSALPQPGSSDSIMSRESRDKLRSSAQQILEALGEGDSSD